MSTELAEIAARTAEDRARGARGVHDHLVSENKKVRADLFKAERELAEVTAEMEKQQSALAAFQAEAPVMARAREEHATLTVANERLRTEVSAAEARLAEVKAYWKRKTAILDALQADLAALGETI